MRIILANLWLAIFSFYDRGTIEIQQELERESTISPGGPVKDYQYSLEILHKTQKLQLHLSSEDFLFCFRILLTPKFSIDGFGNRLESLESRQRALEDKISATNSPSLASSPMLYQLLDKNVKLQ